jgi:hypothetical protein
VIAKLTIPDVFVAILGNFTEEIENALAVLTFNEVSGSYLIGLLETSHGNLEDISVDFLAEFFTS